MTIENYAIYRLSHIAKPMIWGGHTISALFNLADSPASIGEVWTISALRPNPSVFLEGPFKGQPLDLVYQHHPEWFKHASDRFPLLVKFIDAAKPLSVQVHPDDAYAAKHHHSLGKNEAWFILETDPDACLYLGHDFTDLAALKKSIQDSTIMMHLGKLTPKPNDLIYIPAGLLHSIGAGCRLYEVQQSSNQTYRVFDFNRLDQHNQTRNLHLKDALAVTAVPGKYESKPTFHLNHESATEQTLETPFFTLRVYNIDQSMSILLDDKFHGIGCVKGFGTINGLDFEFGTHALAQAGLKQLNVTGKMTLVVVSPKGE